MGFFGFVVLGLLAVWLQKLYCHKRDKLLLTKNSLYPDLDRSSSMDDYSLPHEKTLDRIQTGQLVNMELMHVDWSLAHEISGLMFCFVLIAN